MNRPVTAGVSSHAGRTLAVLHPVFALTGVLHAIGGPLLPSLAAAFHLSDTQSGFLFLAYFAGTSLGALLCGRSHARSIQIGFVGLTFICVLVALTTNTLIYPLFLLLGIGVGMPMSAVSMLAARNFGIRSAATLTFLNFSWSAGALAAPLLAARLLLHHSYRTAYLILAVCAAAAALASSAYLRDAETQTDAREGQSGSRNTRVIALFALLTFLEVGIENTAGSWLATYVLRTSGGGAAAAAASSSLYWCGFLASRGVFSILLLHVAPMRILRLAVAAALGAAIFLLSLPQHAGQIPAMILLGAALAPVFPLLLAGFFAQSRDSSDARWVLAVCGFGGSVLPWATGWISSVSGSLRVGLTTIPAALVLTLLLLTRTPQSAAPVSLPASSE